MPELPEVQTVVNTLCGKLVGLRITRLHHFRADIVTPPSIDLGERLIGREVSAISRRGKRIVFTLDDGNRFYIHLGMSGRLTLETTDEPQRKHTHLILEFSGRPRMVLHFSDPRRFGGIWWLGTDSPAGTMGPEPLRMRPAQLASRLARTRRPIKNALLDQTLVAGIGNIYADEALFRAKIHPLRVASTLTLDEIRRLNRSIKRTLRDAIRYRGSTLRDYVDADGVKGAYQKRHKVYDRADQPCRICRTSVRRIVLSARSAHFCPSCQPNEP